MSWVTTVKNRWKLVLGLVLVTLLLALLGFCSLVWNGVEALVNTAQ